jgi:isochorismate synthase / 2-succinyl-5-enolpyruvyl-6-hydroxy-3-cyclohexene-1-carboxylate synthase / 2-succinyl-6-hydroxy-2,4-cyclohexadiene-1-carboxylate synthase / o-succinylbenzoate synthase
MFHSRVLAHVQDMLAANDTAHAAEVTLVAASAAVHEYTIADVTVGPFSVPLRAPLTSATTDTARCGALVCVHLAAPGGHTFTGTGEVAPLPGLHRESAHSARCQLAALQTCLPGNVVAANVSLLRGQLRAWWAHGLGVAPDGLLPSVQFGVECALIAALGHACGHRTFAEHLSLCALPADGSNTGASSARDALRAVPLNALLDAGIMTPSEAAAAALSLAEDGYTCIKVKVSSARLR